MSQPREPEPEKSCRVYLVHHENGCHTGILMRQWNVFFDAPPPSAYAKSVDEVLAALDRELAQRSAAGTEPLERYLWSETFTMKSVTIDVRPQTFVDKRPVIGQRVFPLTLQYAACQLQGGAWRVGLPRFGWWMVLETLDLAKEALETAIGAALLGEQETLVFEFRKDGKERVLDWQPSFVDLAQASAKSDPEVQLAGEYPVMVQVADELVLRARQRRISGLHAATGTSWTSYLDQARVDHPWSVLLIGPTGVGKSVRVRQFAKLLAQHKPSERNPGRRLWHTSKDRILAGMMYLGMWEERVIKMIEELRVRGDWLWIERLSDLLDPVGGRSGGTIGELLLPALENREIQLISEVTFEEFERLQRRHPRWADVFITNYLTPPSDAILSHWLPSFCESAEIKAGRKPTPWDRVAVRRLLQLQARFEPGVAQPGRGVRFITWWVRAETPPAELTPGAVTDAYARYTGLPVDVVDDRQVASVETIRAALERRVVGQTAAADVAARVIARFKAGVSDPLRPIGTLLFLGPTGVGKTELAKAMCHTMFGADTKMIRLDMSEYQMPWSAERLFQIGRGVTSLAERVRQQPIALVLLDEIEKAHPVIFDTLMAVLDEGRFTDQRGEVVDFRTTLIVMTSNLGAGGPRPTGFSAGMGAGAGTDYFGAARRWFRPELLNRIDHIVPFEALGRASIDKIVDLELTKVTAREGLATRALTLEVAPAVRERLAIEGYHPEYGARALRRVIEDRLVVPLASLLARSPELRDLVLVATLHGDEVVFTIP